MRKLLFVAVMALLCGCGGVNKKQYPEQEPEQSRRFEMKRYEAQNGRSIYVLSDNETGAEYILVYMNYSGVAIVSKPAVIR